MADLFLAGLAAKTGSTRLTVADAISSGAYETERALEDGYESVVSEPDAAPYEMAADVAKQALKEASQSPSIVVYGSIHRHGHARLWSPASWLQNQLELSGTVPAIAIQQGCNGLMQAVAMTMSTGNTDSALFVGADCFHDSGFDRWKSDYGLIYGDAAAAFVLSRKSGFARILHTKIDGVPALEELHRNANPSPETQTSWHTEYDIRRTKRAFLQAHGAAAFADPLVAALQRLRGDLEQNPHWRGEADVLLTPFVGNKTRHATYEHVFGHLAPHNAWDIGKKLGHLGTTDAWVGLDHLRQQGALHSGQHVLIISAGVGFSCGATLLEIL